MIHPWADNLSRTDSLSPKVGQVAGTLPSVCRLNLNSLLREDFFICQQIFASAFIEINDSRQGEYLRRLRAEAVISYATIASA